MSAVEGIAAIKELPHFESEGIKEVNGFPYDHFPSDHIPIGVDIVLEG